jgi:hypothetical protein
VRGFEPLTSGLQSPRSAKLSYTPLEHALLVAGAGFEPATFGLCLPLQLSLPKSLVCGLDFLFTLDNS